MNAFCRKFLGQYGVAVVLCALLALGIFVLQKKQVLPTGRQAELLSYTTTIQGSQRTYFLHVPPVLKADPAPFVIVLHGGPGTARQIMETTAWAEKADIEGFLAAFPEGSPRYPEATSDMGRAQEWNSGDGVTGASQRNIDDTAFIASVIDEVSARFKVDPKRIYITGFSNGASLTFKLGLELSEKVAAVAPVAGALWAKGPNLKSPVSLLTIVGSADAPPARAGKKVTQGDPIKTAIRLASIAQSETFEGPSPVQNPTSLWAELLQCPKGSAVHEEKGVRVVRYSPCRNGSEVVAYVLSDLGHVYPNGTNAQQQASSYEGVRAFNATDVIWEFFQGHKKSY
jgi:polyhydroxybutyrate depolymerase